MKTTSEKDGIIHFDKISAGQTPYLDFRFRAAYQVEDGTIFYTGYGRKLERQIVVMNGETKVSADLQEVTFDRITVLGSALYFDASNQIFKATFAESQGIVVSFVRDIRQDERIESDGLCYIIRDRKRYVYRLGDDPDKDGIHIDVNEHELKAMLATVHKGKAILLRRGDNPIAIKQTENTVLVELPLTNSNSVLSRDCSPFLYFTGGSKLLVLNVCELKFLPPLEIENVPSFECFVGICDGNITVKCGAHGYSEPSIYSARLPNKYFHEILEDDFDIGDTPTEEGEENRENAGYVPLRPREMRRSLGEFSSKFSNEFTITKILGKGGFGCVFEAICKFDDQNYAVKRIPLKAYEMESKQREARAMAQLDHTNIVRYNCSWIEQPPVGWQHESDAKMLKNIISSKDDLMRFREDSAFIYIQMQLCMYSLSDWLKDKDNRNLSARNPSRMKVWFKQLVGAVGYIHSKNLIHRDLKPNNVLFAEKDVLKLCDLGIAATRTDEDELETELSRTDIGTKLYMSPEQRCKSRYSSKSDVFTLGLILAELCIVMTPAQRTEIFDNYRHGEQSDLITDHTTVNFVQLITQVEPATRLSCKEMLDHLFLA